MLQNALDTSLNALDVLLGETPGAGRAALSATAPIPAVPAITDIGSPADLLQRRPDLIIAERRLAATNAGIGAEVAVPISPPREIFG